MNKTEKIICLVLGSVLAWYVFTQSSQDTPDKAAAQGQGPAPAIQQAAQQSPATAPAAAPVERKTVPSVPEKLMTLENDELSVTVSTWGGAVKFASLKKYARGVGEISESNPSVEFDFSSSPLGKLSFENTALDGEVFQLQPSSTADTLVLKNSNVTRKVTLLDGYRLVYEDTFHGDAAASPVRVALGIMRMGDSKNDLLSVDSWSLEDGGEGKVLHHCEGDSPLESYLVGGFSGGCGGSRSAAGYPEVQRVDVGGAQKWIAVKNRFFVTALCPSPVSASGFSAEMARDMKSDTYKLSSVAVSAKYKAAATRRMDFYIGPKKQSLLWDLGMKDVMEFGMWRWICYPLVAVLNFFHSIVPSFGMAIIFLTILVRLVFWPLTHKSTVGMRKMQELQPRMKELQAKFKDNPQRLQQETWALYRAEKVNPMSSCLPMFVQIPVFIALFNVLRSAVELRYAPFLWISDLSEPEALFASWFPIGGGLNILPVLMAITTALQSAFTPSTGDKNQQRMMMYFMPVMMLVMFYSFPSALSLYWFLSNIFSIVQMWIIRRKVSASSQASAAMVEVIDPPQTRQMRRHG